MTSKPSELMDTLVRVINPDSDVDIPALHDKLLRLTQQEASEMTPTQYKAALKALELSQERAGDWLGIGRRTSQGYALGEYPVPEPVAKLLRLCVKLKLKPEDVR